MTVEQQIETGKQTRMAREQFFLLHRQQRTASFIAFSTHLHQLGDGHSDGGADVFKTLQRERLGREDALHRRFAQSQSLGQILVRESSSFQATLENIDNLRAFAHMHPCFLQYCFGLDRCAVRNFCPARLTLKSASAWKSQILPPAVADSDATQMRTTERILQDLVRGRTRV